MNRYGFAGKEPVTAFSLWLSERGISTQALVDKINAHLKRLWEQGRCLECIPATHRTARAWRDGSRLPNPTHLAILGQVLRGYRISAEELAELFS